MNKSKIEKRQAETAADSSTKVDATSVSQTIAKPNVVCSAFAGSVVSEVYLMDCIDLMKHYPDKYFDLAVVDPPYGIDINMNMGRKKGKAKVHNDKSWDMSVPEMLYFIELFRVSQNQIIWGGNYFDLPKTKSWIIWDKNNGESGFSDGEMAWTSFGINMKIKKIHWTGSASNWEDTKGKIHPCQKPLKLYDWIFKNYSTEGMRILDTHLGSGSSRISANKNGLHFVGCGD